MKKNIVLIFMLLTLICFVLIGCDGINDGISTELLRLEIHPSSPRDFEIGEDIDLSKIRIIATYRDGSEEIIQLNDAMLSDIDREKFTTVAASHTIRIEYKGKAVLYNFSISQSIPQTKYNVHFESNGGTEVASQYTNLIEAFTIPIKAGFTFIGWYDNVHLEGIKAEAPYPIYRDTTFFAKWEDNRKHTVFFLDIDENPFYQLTVVHGGDVNMDALPNAPEVEGYRFIRWEGAFYNVTENIEISPVYERIEFTINVYSDEGMTKRMSSTIIPYGEPYNMGEDLKVPEIEGYIGEWKIFTEYGLVDIEDQFLRITQNYDIVPSYQIIRFILTFQDDSFFAGSGTSWQSKSRTVDYGSEFDIVEAGDPLIANPQSRDGHIASWAVLIDGIWMNIDNGATWDETERVWIPSEEPISSIEIKNTSDEVIAVILNGRYIKDIKANIIIQAKYQRERYTLNFVRPSEGSLYTVEGINYNTKFSLYKPQEGDELPEIIYGEKTKRDFVRYNALEDWDIEWYITGGFEEEDKIIFEDHGYITVGIDGIINNNIINFYCKDIDLRTYEVQFFDWDFVNEEYIPLSVPIEIDGVIHNVDTQIVPHGSFAIEPNVNSKIEYGYDFRDSINLWFDAPHGKPYANSIYPNNIQKNTRFYVHYTLRTYSVTFRDFYYPYDDNINADDFSVLEFPPEVTYYTGENGEPLSSGYVYMDAVFIRSHKHEFKDSEIYFGGDEVYNKIKFIQSYLDDEELYDALFLQKDQITAEVDYYSALLRDYYDYEQAVLDYQTDDERWLGYTKPDYVTFMQWRENLYEVEQKLQFVTDYKILYYQDGDSIPEGYEIGDEIPGTGAREREYMLLVYERETDPEGEFITDENGNFVFKTDGEGKYIDNGDYQRMLNLFYQAEGREGYEFDGWFTNPNFNPDSRVSVNVGEEIILQDFVITNNVILYAKWIDLEKGSDGLVFEKVIEPNPEYEIGGDKPEFISYYIVIDYIDIESAGDYVLREVGGETYYEFIDPLTGNTRTLHSNYISFNEMSTIQETELRIPAFHEGLPVKRIREGALEKYGSIIERVSITANIEVIDEGVFAPSYNLEGFTLSEDNEHFELIRGVLYTADGRTLLCYPTKLVIEEYERGGITVPSTTYIVPAEVTRIAKAAFSKTNLQYIAFELGDIEDKLVIGEEAFMSCQSLLRIGHLSIDPTQPIYTSDTCLPDRLVKIGARAFQNCYGIMESITTTIYSELLYVGENAFEATQWYTNLLQGTTTARYIDGTSSNGVITIGYVVLGVSNISSNVINLHSEYTRSIADKAFYGKGNIKRIQILNSNFVHIGNNAFSQMGELERLDIHVADPQQLSLGDNIFGSSGYFNIYVPQGSVGAYQIAEGWSQYAEYFRELEF